MMKNDVKMANREVRTIYDVASDSFDHPANAYWERYGRRTVERLELKQGARVLDVACGTGASALPAAEIVGPYGRVTGMDISEEMLALARSKAAARGLRNVRFHKADMVQLYFEDGTFDAVVCVFGIFFVAEMEAVVANLWRMLRPGAQLAITTWASGLFEPMYSAFNAAVRSERPDLVSDLHPWHRLTTPSAVQQLLRNGGATNITTEVEHGVQRLANAESWWKIVLGSGLRATVEAMGPELAQVARLQNAAYIERENVKSVNASVVYGVAHKTGGPR